MPQSLEEKREKARYYQSKYPKEKKISASHSWRLRDYENYLYISAKKNAERMGREFTITKEDIVIPTHCPYLGVALERRVDIPRYDYNPSLDRINPAKGYTPDNIQVTSIRANRLKNSFTPTELVTICKNILRLHGDL